jgi:hypothetical protein
MPTRKLRFAGDTLAKGKSIRTIGPYGEEASSVAEDELRGIERGSPLKVVSSAGVPMVRIHLPPAESQQRTPFVTALLWPGGYEIPLTTGHTGPYQRGLLLRIGPGHRPERGPVRWLLKGRNGRV